MQNLPGAPSGCGDASADGESPGSISHDLDREGTSIARKGTDSTVEVTK